MDPEECFYILFLWYCRRIPSAVLVNIPYFLSELPEGSRSKLKLEVTLFWRDSHQNEVLFDSFPMLRPLDYLKLLVTTGFNGLDGLTFKPDHQPLKTHNWSGLRLKPYGLDH